CVFLFFFFFLMSFIIKNLKHLFFPKNSFYILNNIFRVLFLKKQIKLLFKRNSV
ncbi:hypothetical protein HN51_026466, partial [Arachis hypogaea]